MTCTLNINLADILEQKYPHGFHVPVDVDMLLEFGNDDWDYPVDFDAHLAADNQVALIWTVDDVLSRRSDLTEEQAWRVLTTARDDFRRDECHLDFLESTANGLFPIGDQAKESLRLRLSGLLKSIEALPSDNLAKTETFTAVARQLDAIERSLEGGQP